MSNDLMNASQAYAEHEQGCAVCRDSRELCPAGMRLMMDFQHALHEWLLRGRLPRPEN